MLSGLKYIKFFTKSVSSRTQGTPDGAWWYGAVLDLDGVVVRKGVLAWDSQEFNVPGLTCYG